MVNRISRTMVRYYTALRISAAAATVFLPADPPQDQPPIVRASDTRLSNGFDRRELVQLAGQSHVVTLAAAPVSLAGQFWQN